MTVVVTAVTIAEPGSFRHAEESHEKAEALRPKRF